MPVEPVNIDKFLEFTKSFPVLDVRSPGEFSHAHFPEAFSLPLFTDEQRKIIGTAYKQQNRHVAVDIGLQYFSDRMKRVYDDVDKILAGWMEEKKITASGNNVLLMYCWRGGMRSGAMAWLLSLYGYRIYVLIGGYKSFRRWTLAQFERQYNLHIIGGFTGSGKTEILMKLKQDGHKVIDLEGLANHKGSAFGSLGQGPQPSAEMFENRLAMELYRGIPLPEIITNDNGYAKADNEHIWIEDESMHVGSVGIPKAFWNQMRESNLFFIDIPFEERLKNIVARYGKYEKPELETCILKIQKRLGGLETKSALQSLKENRIQECFSILLRYYDKLYNVSLHNRENLALLLNKIPCTSVDIINAAKVCEKALA